MLWFWWPHANAWAAPLILALIAGLLTWRLPSGPARRFCCSLLLVDALSCVAVAGYVVPVHLLPGAARGRLPDERLPGWRATPGRDGGGAVPGRRSGRRGCANVANWPQS
jgi:hypothetical protein